MTTSMIPFFHIDAFVTDKKFSGNPAGVCFLEEWLNDDTLLSIASSLKHSETAFIVPRIETDHYELRWFAPKVEVALCGHGTLAAARAICEITGTRHFHTKKSGVLEVSPETQDEFGLKFPIFDIKENPAEERSVLDSLHLKEGKVYSSSDRYVILLKDYRNVDVCEPDMERMKKLPLPGVIITAPSKDAPHRFVFRYFAPAKGIPEDPATGSAICVLAPFWRARLGVFKLSALQLSERTAEFQFSLEKAIELFRSTTSRRVIHRRRLHSPNLRQKILNLSTHIVSK